MVFQVKGKEPLTARVNLRVTPGELDRLKDDADTAGLSVSELVRKRYFGRRITAHADNVMLKELRRQGGLLNKVHKESGGAYSSETAAMLKKIGALIDQIASAK